MIWTPDALEPPELESFPVGIEVFSNHRQLLVGESIQRAYAVAGNKDKQAGVPLVRTRGLEPLEKWPSPREAKPWELPHMPPRPRNLLQKGGGANAGTFSRTGLAAIQT